MTFQATVERAGGKTKTCGHKHRSHEAAQSCGEKTFGNKPFEIAERKARKYVSRAARLGDAEGRFSSAHSTITELANTVRSYLTDLETDQEPSEDNHFDEAAASEALQSASNDLSDAKSELESLQEEIGQWKEGLEGTNLEQSTKYSDLETAYDALQEVIDFADSAESDEPTLPSEMTREALDAFADECDSFAEQLEQAEQACGNVEFPGMY